MNEIKGSVEEIAKTLAELLGGRIHRRFKNVVVLDSIEQINDFKWQINTPKGVFILEKRPALPKLIGENDEWVINADVEVNTWTNTIAINKGGVSAMLPPSTPSTPTAPKVEQPKAIIPMVR